MEDGLKCGTFPAEVAALAPVVKFVREGGRSARLGQTDLDRLELVLEEVFLNLVHHAYAPGRAGIAEVAYAVQGPGALSVQVADHGAPFNPLEQDDPDLELALDERPIGGLGIFLIKTLPASISYARAGGRNVLTLCFRTTEAA